jgi:hypothetical protein
LAGFSILYGVSSRSGLGRASNTLSENKNLYLETNEYYSMPPFSKKTLGGSILGVTFGGNFFKKTFGGNFSKNI